MRRWMVLAVMALMVAVPASGYAQTPSGDKMKDDKMKMEQGDKMEKKDERMKVKMMKDDKMEKNKMMEKKETEKK
jgi:pentapeptide MXKDX repeat protein